jgi:hypothetical protein
VGAFGGYTGTTGAAPPFVPDPGAAAVAPLHAAQAAAVPDNAGDAVLAHEISQILKSYGEGRRPQSPKWIPPEPVALVAHMFDRYYQDPRLPEQFKPILGKLQMPVMKAALSDRSFFSNPQHPARRIIGDLFEMLLQAAPPADARPLSAPPSVLEGLDGLANAVADAYRLDLGRLQSAEPGAFDDETADAFLRQQEELKRRKAGARIERVRRVVSHELERRIGDRALDAGVMRLLLSGFGPMLGAACLRGGIDGPQWTESCALVERVLHSLRPCGAGEERVAENSAVIAAILQGLERIGMPESRAETLVSGLRQAYAQLSADVQAGDAGTEPLPVPEPEPISPQRELQGLLSILLVPATWYTIYDAVAGSKHWVRVKAFYPERSTVLFEHYMEPRFMRLRANAFATIVSDGHATPIDASPDLQRAIARIRELPFEHASDRLVWAEPAQAFATRH